MLGRISLLLLFVAAGCASPVTPGMMGAEDSGAVPPDGGGGDLAQARSCWGAPPSSWGAPAALTTLAGDRPGPATLSDDGLTLTWTATPPMRAHSTVYQARRGDLAAAFSGGMPVAQWNGAIAVADVTHATQSGARELLVGGNGDLWVSTRASASAPWEEPARLDAPVMTMKTEDYAAVTGDGLRLFFHRDDGAAPFAWQIHQVRRSTAAPGGAWTGDEVVFVDGVDPQRFALLCPVVSRDGKRLFFTAPIERAGDGDLYVTERAGEGSPWGAPVRLAGLSTDTDHDCADAVSADGCELYLHRAPITGMGAVRLYTSRRTPGGK